MTRTLFKSICLGLTILLFSGQLFAQEVSGGDKGKVNYRKKTVIDFSDVTIEGELTKPEASYLMNRKKSRFNMMIKMRDNFIPEMLKSVDNM